MVELLKITIKKRDKFLDWRQMMRHSHPARWQPRTNGKSPSVKQRIELYFIPFAKQVERLLYMVIVGLFIALLVAQFMILHFPEHQDLFNKAIQYEGVFREDQVESRATLQQR